MEKDAEYYFKRGNGSEKGFQYFRESTYSCGGVTNTVNEYKHIETGIEFVLVPGGSFMMGSPDSDDMADDWEKPQHEVTVSPFLMAKYTVTQSVWRKIMNTKPWQGKENVKQGNDYPAVYITWNDAKKFCNKIGLFLPSEAEWEYAYRGGAKTRYYWGNDPDGKYMWYGENVYNVGEKYPHRVGKKIANAYGLHDMSGNVWEWCEDWYSDYQLGSVVNPTGPTIGTTRVLRGGNCFNFASYVRSAARHRNVPADCGLTGVRLSLRHKKTGSR